MSHTPDKTTHPPQDVTSPTRSPLSPSRPSSLGGPRLNKARTEDMHRRHSSSISYRKSPPDEANLIRLHHARSSLASTWTQPDVTRNRCSLQLEPLNLYGHFHTAGPVVESPGQVQRGPPASKSWASSEGFAVQTMHTHSSRTGSISTTTSNPSCVPPTRALSLIDQHVDLLTYIAKKERRCLDLREELQKSEDELRKLKRKWEIVVGRSLASPTSTAGASPPIVDPRRHPSTSGSVPQRQHGSSPSSHFIPVARSEAARQEEDLADSHELELRSHQSPHDAQCSDPLRQDRISWDPFLQHIGPVSSVAKKWVGGIGKGFLDLLQETQDTPCPSPSPSRNVRDYVAPARPSSLHRKHKLIGPTSPSMPTKLLLEKSMQNRDEAVSSALQQEPSAVSFPSSPAPQLRMRTHAHSCSSNSNSVADSFDADTSNRTSMSSIVPTSVSDADSATTTAVHCPSNTTHRTFFQSSLTGGSPFTDIASEPCVIESEGHLTFDDYDRSRMVESVSHDQFTPSSVLEAPSNNPSISAGIPVEEENSTHQSPHSFHSSKTIESNCQSSKKHQSRRSTFDFLNSTTGQWTANLTKTLGDITNSETFQTSKRATLNFVDTMEKTFTDVIANDASPRPEVGCSSTFNSTAPPRPFGENDKAPDDVFEVPFY